MDQWIEINELWVWAKLGVTDRERLIPQRLVVTIKLWIERDFDHLDDSLENTVNYSSVASETKRFISETSSHLLENLAIRVGDHLLARFSFPRIEIIVKKFALPNAQFVSVRTLRERRSS
ncbi:MAG: dihydroneopterin aldolase [Verrucomicrobia bacterium]|nr:dihydroneopterin aldolase [Verrucomicrobiota bacterium]MBV9673578.1 dihydroneopterin aldolase [Verrucomicrobiota bacterium]